MAEPLKAMYDDRFIKQFARLVKSVWEPFQEVSYYERVIAGDWEQLELKARTRRLTESLGAELPSDYEAALSILYRIDAECLGMPYLFFPDFVEVYGQQEEHWGLSMEALERFTARSTAEYAVRPFLLRNQGRMLRQMMEWTSHSNEHVRRLASEGVRPRLPWAQALPMFKQDPAPIIPILDSLKQDSSLYVRKSVANCLNDISKDHPELVIELAERWQGVHPHTDWIIRRGCRSLIKAAHPAVMSLFGYTSAGGDGVEAAEAGSGSPLVAEATLRLTPETLFVGGETLLQYQLRLRDGEPIKARLEYGIDFVKAREKTSHKRFLLADKVFPGGKLVDGVKVHRFADLSTRKHYPGLHRISLWFNGREIAASEIMVTDLD
ncbi:DNA alkylation repair protein [Paenibacillus sp. GCM10023252]|uniref:DNA alkylation repair protein n=1 Tax=Paenibacillus sp. GCM10023252 TaxID=3252649 RepID=UPI003615DDF4